MAISFPIAMAKPGRLQLRPAISCGRIHSALIYHKVNSVSFWSMITGGLVDSGAKAVQNIAQVWTPNAEATSAREHDLSKSSLDQFSSEFHSRKNRTVFDAAVDSLNRLPRPVITFCVIWLFAISYFDTKKFIDIMTAWSIVPAGLFALLGAIVTFFFGSRATLYNRDFQMTKDQLALANRLAAKQEEAKPDVDPRLETKPIPASRNRVVDEWLKLKKS